MNKNTRTYKVVLFLNIAVNYANQMLVESEKLINKTMLGNFHTAKIYLLLNNLLK